MTSKKDLEIFLYKNKLNTKTIVEILPNLSSQTITSLLKDFGCNLEKQYKDESNQIYIFTDGGCKYNGKKDALAGYSVFFTENEDSIFYKFNTTKRILTEPTNNKAELSGIKYIFKVISENKCVFSKMKIVICTDSMYCINCIEKWSSNWELNNWKNAKGENVKNQDIIKQILDYKKSFSDIEIKFQHVFSHIQEPQDKNSFQYKLWYGNNYVDKSIQKLLES